MSKHRSPRLGHRVEQRVIEEQGYSQTEIDRSWFDAQAGTVPVEIKGAMRVRSNGSEGRFRIFREPHRQLSAADGVYAFAPYQQRGSGVEILEIRTVRARELRGIEWSRSHHQTRGRDQQTKLPISQVMR